ncbi:Ca(2+)-dependent cysteine protease [Coemansia sp. RSA 1813]|nr:Ca(2+)-dependent cysteine protease [Coemansia sp. RSA 1646]KAJ1767298.1 Ca(2+)-dependent cysteine protease [Coemansia sp. RSA 1843]KAJ2089441.1 Ca(2+)-dependent cysteine protease [Coemansia sp. RSA 986]KAJ2214923.1 Ca(2+)-dependent cysteine protease [Coemansia sp. RSA 487]KAJ2563806.1 Ca(2+)-dependent cysteine protease [Coemansia sp. RSA 1813]
MFPGDQFHQQQQRQYDGRPPPQRPGMPMDMPGGNNYQPPPPQDDYEISRSYGGNGGGYNNYNNGGGGYNNYNEGDNNYNGGGGYNQGYQQPPPPQRFPGQGYAQNDGYGYGMSGPPPPPPPPPAQHLSRHQQNRGPPPPPARFPGEGYGGPPDNFGPGSRFDGPRFPGEGYSGGPPPPPPPPPSSSYGPSGGYGMPGEGYGPPSGEYGQAPPMNMPVVRHRLEDIDFSNSNFPSWHQSNTPAQPPPPQQNNGGGGYFKPTHGTIPTYNIPQELQQEASKVTLSNCQGRKRALLIGINYFGSKHMLKGCINDVHNMKKFIVEHFGFKEDDMVILTDDQRENKRRMPTHDNIIKAMKWLVSDARMNDSFFFHYSGHGTTIESNNSEEIDGRDETICPVDFESKGQIVDDDMNAIMVRPLPRGARLTAIFDCCHSATALDLPFMYNHMGKLKNEKAITYAGKGLMAAGNLYMQGNIAGALKGFAKSVDMALTGDSKLDTARRTKSTLGDVVMFSGCKDDQTSADTKSEDLAFTGAMSYALISSMNNNPHQTYVQLLQDIRKRLSAKYTQVPQLSTGRLMDMNTIFVM